MPKPSEPSLDGAYALETPEDNRRLYRDWAKDYDQDFAARSGYRFARLIARAYLTAGGTWPALDVGCGTGLIGADLPAGAIIDGVDISAEMLAVARDKGLYRALIEADLTARPNLGTGGYAGLLSAGTFTHGHVGPEVLAQLLDAITIGGVVAISSHSAYFASTNFQGHLDDLQRAGRICAPKMAEERIYQPGADAPPGHENDLGYVIVFNKTG